MPVGGRWSGMSQTARDVRGRRAWRRAETLAMDDARGSRSKRALGAGASQKQAGCYETRAGTAICERRRVVATYVKALLSDALDRRPSSYKRCCNLTVHRDWEVGSLPSKLNGCGGISQGKPRPLDPPASMRTSIRTSTVGRRPSPRCLDRCQGDRGRQLPEIARPPARRRLPHARAGLTVRRESASPRGAWAIGKPPRGS